MSAETMLRAELPLSTSLQIFKKSTYLMQYFFFFFFSTLVSFIIYTEVLFS